MKEWKDIEGYEGYYKVSNTGDVKGLDRYTKSGKFIKEEYLKPTLNDWGYLCVTLCKLGTRSTQRVHRLVCKSFVIGDNRLTVNHKDEVKINNYYTNLEWMSNEGNVRIAQEKTYSLKNPKGEIHTFTGMSKFCKKNDLTQSAVSLILSGVRKRHKGWTSV